MSGAPPRLPVGFHLQAYDRLASTNDEAKRLARSGAAAGTTVWTREQTAGRGRRGRSWVAIPGNLYVSFIMRPEGAAAAAAQLGFVAALALGGAVAELLPAMPDLRYKWPNDVLLGGRKVSGILLESETSAAGTSAWVVIGIGVNVVAHPPGLPYPATSLRQEGAGGVDAVTVLETLATHLQKWHRRWCVGGFAPVRAAWLGRAFGLGEVQTARFAQGEETGRFVDLDADGALLLDTPQGPRRIAAGEIFPASA
ncbi:MAG TPA: biotin--[acetyl-CoA-carboxylase] ligase [Stellaceae bacterium]|nr:biotin--[acetyl-CoA-carboxylase] ligase [Stellaceae bacterium]